MEVENYCYDIDMLKCIYCGLCEHLVQLTRLCKVQILNLPETREELYYNKEKLLENGDRWENILANINADSSADNQ